VLIEYRWAKGDYSLLPALAADLARVEGGGYCCHRRHRLGASGEIGDQHESPVVFTIGADPVGHGLVASPQPARRTHLTGVNLFSSILSGKRIGALDQGSRLNARRIALIMNPDNFTAAAEEQDGFAECPGAPSRGRRRQSKQTG
jgi:hypothetical protein